MAAINTYILSLTDTYKPTDWPRGSSAMVFVPGNVMAAMNTYFIARITGESKDGDAEQVLATLKEALSKGEIYTFSLSASKYIKPVAIAGFNHELGCLEIETRPGDIRKFRLQDICSTADLRIE